MIQFLINYAAHMRIATEIRIPFRRGLLDTPLCDKVCQ